MKYVQFPKQQLSLRSKTKEWRKQCVDAADSDLHHSYSAIRDGLLHQRINYDLVNGKIHMDDIQGFINPEGIQAGFIPDNIQHYPIMNSSLFVLQGEESKRLFDYHSIVTNPEVLSDMEKSKADKVREELQAAIQDESRDQEEFQKELQRIDKYYKYTYKDFREVWGNCVLKHYASEQNFALKFNKGFRDAETVGEEIYHIDIVGGEPVLEKLEPMNVRVYMNGYSNNIEDADRVVLEDYWSPGRIYDTFYDVLTKKDIKYIEELPDSFARSATDELSNWKMSDAFIHNHMIDDTLPEPSVFFDTYGASGLADHLMPYDYNGNIRVMRVYWKSRKKIQCIKHFDDETGEELIDFYDENYIPDESRGEESVTYWINEAWEGTKIGEEVYVNIRPCLVKYNSLNNPSRCHFGIIGSIYNFGNGRPFSLVDMMKPLNYLYDVIHDRLNKMMARNWGKLVRLDFSKKPKSWKVEQWMYYARTMGLYVEDSFNEGTSGASLGKIAMNANTTGVIDADFGNNIQQYINLLEYLKQDMKEIAGISKQREGQVSNRETVGGVERATLQSSHITEWIFTVHEDIKRRVLNAFLEAFKVSMRGKRKKFKYITPDFAEKFIEIDGEIFNECDMGVVVDSNNAMQELGQNLAQIGQAALQNQLISFSTLMKLYTSASYAEKQRYIEADEERMRQEAQQNQQQQLQAQQQQAQAQLQQQQAEMQLKDQMNQRDNETKIAVAEINSQAELAVLQMKNDMVGDEENAAQMEKNEIDKEKLMQEMQMLDKKLNVQREIADKQLEFNKDKAAKDREIKEKQIRAQQIRRASK